MQQQETPRSKVHDIKENLAFSSENAVEVRQNPGTTFESYD
jgi:hypothetical protein